MFSVRNMLLGSNGIVTIVVALLLTMLIAREWRLLTGVVATAQVSAITSTMSRAAIELSLERSVTQLSLRLDQPISGPFRSMLETQRDKSAALFAEAESLIRGAPADLVGADTLARLSDGLRTIETLRRTAEPLLAVPLSRRDEDVARRVPVSFKAAILELNRIQAELGAGVEAADPALALFAQMAEDAWSIREYGGRERTLIAVAAARSDPIPLADLLYMKENHGRAAQAMDRLLMARSNPSVSARLKAEIDALHEAYFETYGAVRAAMIAAENGRYPMDFQTFFPESEKAMGSAVAFLSTLVEEIDVAAQRQRKAALASLAQETVLALFVIGVIAYSVWYALVRVANPLKNITRRIDRIVEGDYDGPVEGTSRGDEIGAIARALSVFARGLSDAEHLRAGQRDAERRNAEAMVAARHRIADEFERTMGVIASDFRNTSQEIGASARELADGAVNTAGQAEVVARSSSEATNNVQSVAASAEDLSTSIRALAAKVDRSARAATAAVEDGRNATSKIAELSTAADEIGAVVDLISGIAAQTNLLALNATIEAARAGEAGRGFAIVASEVKDLAAQTAKATDEIGRKIVAIQSQTGASVDAIVRISHTIEEVRVMTEEIVRATEGQLAETARIAQNTQRAATGAAAVSTAVAEVEATAASAGRASGRMIELAQSLTTRSKDLSSEVTSLVANLRAG